MSRLTERTLGIDKTAYIVSTSYYTNYTGSSTIRIVQSGCGNGIRSGYEQCDDGNTENGDGCDQTCQPEGGYCNYRCDYGICREQCAKYVCGNGYTGGNNESCDDGNHDDGDGCSSTCGVESGWQCSTRYYSSYYPDLSRLYGSMCYPITCGDRIYSNGEGCDDGNQSNGDGCSSSCTVEYGYHCYNYSSRTVWSSSDSLGRQTYMNVNYSQCNPCGDGRMFYGEQCDDYNTDNGDGCNDNCQVEDGYVCSIVQPSVCAESPCGDGVGDTLETCPDTVIRLDSDTYYPVALSDYSDDNTVGGPYNSSGSPYFMNRGSSTTPYYSNNYTYPYKAYTITNDSNTSKSLIFEALFQSGIDGYLYLVPAPFRPRGYGGLSTYTSNDNGSDSTCYSRYQGSHHSCIRYTMSPGQTMTIVATTNGTRTTGAGPVEVKIYEQ